MDKPITPIVEIHEHYYNNTVIERYNNTIIVVVNNTVVVNETVVEEDPIPDRSKPIEYHTFISSEGNPYYILEYNMSEHEIYYYEAVQYPLRAQQFPSVHIIQKSWLDIWLSTNEDIGDFFGGFSVKFTWTPPYLDTWCIILRSNIPYLPNDWDWQFYDRIVTRF